jgi:hypothetical protein
MNSVLENSCAIIASVMIQYEFRRTKVLRFFSVLNMINYAAHGLAKGLNHISRRRGRVRYQAPRDPTKGCKLEG